jgi:hypothetical protein
MSSANRVKSILLANSGPAAASPRKPVQRSKTRAKRRDDLRLIFATTVMVGALAGLYAFVDAQPVAKIAAIGADEAVLRRNQALIRAHRMGSILFMSPYQYCELHRFDNFTGNTVAIDYVDCEATAEEQITANTLAAKSENMKGMLSGFKK